MLNSALAYGHRVQRVVRDVRDARECMTRVCGEHELRVDGRRPLSFEHAVGTLGPRATTIGCIGYGTDVTVRVDAHAPLNCYSISLPLSGQQELVANGRRFHSDADLGLVVAPAMGQELRLSGDCQKLLLAIDRQVMRHTVEDLLGRRVEQDVVFDPVISLGRGEAVSWWRMVRLMWEDLGRLDSLCANQTVAGGLEDSVIRGLLAFQPNNYSAELAARAGRDLPRHVAALRDFLVAHAREDIRAEDLLGIGGVSASRMAADFRKHLGATPLQFLKRHRMERVRQLIVGAAHTKSVSEVAMEWGFTHLGRFSQDYRDTFGELPSATALRHRSRQRSAAG